MLHLSVFLLCNKHEVQELLRQNDEIKKQELLAMVEESGRTYDEIIEFLKTAPKRKIESTEGKAKIRAEEA